jgi:hypothetical protein
MAYTIAWFTQYFKTAQLFLLGYCSVASFCQHEKKKKNKNQQNDPELPTI